MNEVAYNKFFINMNWYKKIPKIELHIHLEGAIPLPTMWLLIQKYGGDKTVTNYEQLVKKFEYKNINEYEDFRLIAESAAKNLAEQNIRYAEMFYSPSSYREKKLHAQKITEAIFIGFSRVKNIKISLIADFVRNHDPKNELFTLEVINEVKEMGIIGIGIGGSEKEFPPGPFEHLFNKARSYGFRTNAHAGEAAGPESIWEAIKKLKVDRIGHGTNAFMDPGLMDYLANNKIPLEVCPLSNIKTKTIKNPPEHPVRKFFEHGILISINTDDPAMFGNSLDMEYKFLEETMGFTKKEICSVILTGIRTSWMKEKEKSVLIKEFRDFELWVE